MKTYKHILILILLIGSSFTINKTYGKTFGFVPTNNNAYLFTPQNLGTATPQVTDMIRYGNVQVNKYHGLLDFGISLDGYRDHDFDIPISLKYISSGFMPSKRPSYVGYNWIINCGGVITRTLNGSPDDTKGKARNSENDRDYLLDGKLVAIRENRFTNYSDANLMSFNVNFNSKGNGTPYDGGDFQYDLEPDIFTFAFGNYYGRFIIGNNDIPVLLEDNGCKINIDGMPIQSYSTTAIPISSSIRITTPDGYIYTFGGDNKYLEYFIPNNPSKCKIMPRYITSWFLKSIEAPNSRMVNFSYHSKMQLNKYRYIAYMEMASDTQTSCSPIGQGGGEGSSASHDLELEKPVIKDKIYTPILDSVSIDNVSIRFTYDENVPSFYSDESDDKSIQLKKIIHYVNNTVLKEAEFVYLAKDRYFFLESVSQNGLNHKFNYNLSNTLPNPMTLSVDHWGFWAGGYETDVADWKAYCLDLKNKRKTNSEVCDVGLLNKIIYPTGGVSKITYEYNRYNTYFIRLTNILYAHETNDVQVCGGARVSKVQDFENQTSTTTINTRQFYYQSLTKQEFGVINMEPKYTLSEAFLLYGSYTFPYATGNLYMPIMLGLCTAGTTTYITNISANSYGSNNLLSEYHVAYPYVNEVFENNSSIQYKFSSLIDVPDSYDTGVKITYLNASTLGTYGIAEKYGTLFTNDMSRFRGKLIEETAYDVSGNIVLQKTNKYNIENAKTKYSISLKSSPRSLGYYKIYQTPCLLIQQDITDQNGVKEQVSYTYNDTHLIRSIVSTNSNKKESMKIYKYTGDYQIPPVGCQDNPSRDGMILQSMQDKHIIGNLVEEQSLIKENDNWNALKGKIIRYGLNNLPKEEYILETTTPLSNFVESQVLEVDNNLHFNDHYKKRITYDKYDTYGNPNQIVKDNFNTTVYLWGYTGQYPIAEINNATYAEVETAAKSVFSVASMDALSKLVTPNETKLKDGSLQRALPNAMVTTYTCKPLIGIQTATDPRGVKITYQYDSFGRLQSMMDENGKTMENYQYHYKNQ
ncbi:MAG: hypothetical protein EZS26_001302 [Candidatus Ordinivivax streblomastigis]|uniref:YD repeat-containing protein n=1 Tax=Candidatus Ordinivivax streblomastigis TaxID=2540710 RepID=A0A5M8P2G7_9BACT|nr:MAG: hypothetical protein EZS26_001302 [Candidatus Ordinivivax streblomastigis]